jgi:O-acetyl-ADP-ribose deacetylase (regulator of RNase III)
MSRVEVGAVNIFAPNWSVDPGGALVVPVNTIGVMGAGLALDVAKRYPEVVAPYKAACRSGSVRPGEAHVFAVNDRVWFAATKADWRAPSRGSWVVSCAEQIAALSHRRPDVREVAVPALGCGLGCLSWEAYGPAIAEALRGGARHVTFFLSPPRAP